MMIVRLRASHRQRVKVDVSRTSLRIAPTPLPFSGRSESICSGSLKDNPFDLFALPIHVVSRHISHQLEPHMSKPRTPTPLTQTKCYHNWRHSNHIGMWHCTLCPATAMLLTNLSGGKFDTTHQPTSSMLTESMLRDGALLTGYAPREGDHNEQD